MRVVDAGHHLRPGRAHDGAARAAHGLRSAASGRLRRGDLRPALPTRPSGSRAMPQWRCSAWSRRSEARRAVRAHSPPWHHPRHTAQRPPAGGAPARRGRRATSRRVGEATRTAFRRTKFRLLRGRRRGGRHRLNILGHGFCTGLPESRPERHRSARARSLAPGPASAARGTAPWLHERGRAAHVRAPRRSCARCPGTSSTGGASSAPVASCSPSPTRTPRWCRSAAARVRRWRLPRPRSAGDGPGRGSAARAWAPLARPSARASARDRAVRGRRPRTRSSCGPNMSLHWAHDAPTLMREWHRRPSSSMAS